MDTQKPESIKVIFGSNWKLFSVVIRLFTLSDWCHCGVLFKEGGVDYVIDTTLMTGGRKITADEWKTHYGKWEVAELPTKDLATSLSYAHSRIGLKYDMLGILSFILRKNYQQKQNDFCSELVADVVGIKHKSYRLSPAFLYRLSKALKDWVI